VFLDGETHSTFTEGADAPLRPVDGVSWSDLRYFTLWPNNQGEYRHDNFVSANCILAKLSRFGLFIDLPTSTEWEYACRAGTQTRFGNGTDDEAGMAQMGWYNGNAGGTTHPVGLKEPNEWGFYDMHGNVLEWCLDQYRSSSLSDRDVVRTDYPGEATASSSYSNCKARRGGAYNRPYDESASHWFIEGQWETAKCGYRICVKAVIP
jgi:formylglycine-generating enzyme required for sulfatase activity